jgi:hypothetical protein
MSWELFAQVCLLMLWGGILLAVVGESIVKDYFKARAGKS